MYENSPIKASLIASMMVLVESLKKATNVKMDILAKEIQKANNQLLPYIETVKKYEKQVSALRNNGFSSAEIQKPQNVKFAEEKIAEAQHFLKSLRTLEAIKNLRFFGDNALLVRYDDFEKIMYAYNLRCSTLDKFKGEIPAEKIDGLCAIFDRMESLNTYWRKTINKLDYRSFSGDRFPFRMSYSGDISLFIVAPTSQIVQKNVDPFVCAHTDYGILVLEKWGEEADDDRIKQYENTPLAFWFDILSGLEAMIQKETQESVINTESLNYLDFIPGDAAREATHDKFQEFQLQVNGIGVEPDETSEPSSFVLAMCSVVFTSLLLLILFL